MNLAILALFVISGMSFVLSYLSIMNDEAFLGLLFFGTGLFLSISGVVITARIKA